MAALYLDHGVALAVIAPLQNAGHDVLTVKNLGLRAAGDDHHLLAAAHLGRILVTYDADFILLHNAWRRWSADWGVSPRHSGILITPQPPVCSAERAVRELVAVLTSSYAFKNELYRWVAGAGWIHHPNP